MLFHIPINADTVSLICLGAFAVTAVIYLKRLVIRIALRSRPKYTYHALWAVPYGTTLMMFFSSGRYSCSMFLLWIFSVICAIIYMDFPIRRSQHWIWEAGMKHVIRCIDWLKAKLLWFWDSRSYSAKMVRRSLLISIIGALLILGIFFRESVYFTAGVVVVFCVYCILLFAFTLYECISSCKALVRFWSLYAILPTWGIYSILATVIPGRLWRQPPVAYTCICIILTIFWCLSAGIADYDVAKMAGAIVNTSTTILLLAINILFGWMWRVEGLIPAAASEEFIYAVNLIVFPVVAAGYLAVLFTDGINYWRKRYLEPEKPEAREARDNINVD